MWIRINRQSQRIYLAKKSVNIGQDWKNSISTFAYFLTATAKFNFWKGDWTLGCLHPNLKFVQYLIIS